LDTVHAASTAPPCACCQPREREQETLQVIMMVIHCVLSESNRAILLTMIWHDR